MTVVLVLAALAATAGGQPAGADVHQYRNVPPQDVGPPSPGPTDPNGPST